MRSSEHAYAHAFVCILTGPGTVTSQALPVVFFSNRKPQLFYLYYNSNNTKTAAIPLAFAYQRLLIGTE
jgi:hypothetical protein